MKNVVLAAAFATVATTIPAHAAITVSEVSPWSSGDSTYAADWFELTNTGSTTVDISGWTMDDDSNSFSNSVALTGVSSIAAGQSVVFIEGDTTTVADFEAAWFGANVPVGFTVGYYSGSKVGLSTSGDGVNIFDVSGNWITGVSFGDSTTGFTFDNSAGTNGAISTLSSVGVNGAFTSFDGTQVGSPGVVPLPGALSLMLSALGVIGGAARIRRSR